MNRLEKKLIKMNVCDEAIEWASGQTGSFQESWDQCPRGDWMLLLLTRSKSSKKKLVLASCQIARTVLKYVPKGEKRPLRAIMAAESWVKGEVDLEEVKMAAFASTAASGTAYGAGAGAASSAAGAASVAYAAWAWAADYASDAATSAYWANYSAAGYAYASDASKAAAEERKKSYLNSANIIRKLFPKYPK